MKLFFGGTDRECGKWDMPSMEKLLLVGLRVCDIAVIGNNPFREVDQVETWRIHLNHNYICEEMYKVRKPCRAPGKIEL